LLDLLSCCGCLLLELLSGRDLLLELLSCCRYLLLYLLSCVGCLLLDLLDLLSSITQILIVVFNLFCCHFFKLSYFSVSLSDLILQFLDFARLVSVCSLECFDVTAVIVYGEQGSFLSEVAVPTFELGSGAGALQVIPHSVVTSKGIRITAL
jgi:hypothetical protein